MAGGRCGPVVWPSRMGYCERRSACRARRCASRGERVLSSVACSCRGDVFGGQRLSRSIDSTRADQVAGGLCRFGASPRAPCRDAFRLLACPRTIGGGRVSGLGSLNRSFSCRVICLIIRCAAFLRCHARNSGFDGLDLASGNRRGDRPRNAVPIVAEPRGPRHARRSRRCWTGRGLRHSGRRRRGMALR